MLKGPIPSLLENAMRLPLFPILRICLPALVFTVLAVQPLRAQPSPQPPECACSLGVNVGTAAEPVVIRHCQCGIMSCVVVVQSGQLQCTR